MKLLKKIMLPIKYARSLNDLRQAARYSLALLINWAKSLLSPAKAFIRRTPLMLSAALADSSPMATRLAKKVFFMRRLTNTVCAVLNKSKKAISPPRSGFIYTKITIVPSIVRPQTMISLGPLLAMPATSPKSLVRRDSSWPLLLRS